MPSIVSMHTPEQLLGVIVSAYLADEYEITSETRVILVTTHNPTHMVQDTRQGCYSYPYGLYKVEFVQVCNGLGGFVWLCYRKEGDTLYIRTPPIKEAVS